MVILKQPRVPSTDISWLFVKNIEHNKDSQKLWIQQAIAVGMDNITSEYFPRLFLKTFVTSSWKTNTWWGKNGILLISSNIISNSTYFSAGGDSHRYPPYPWTHMNHDTALKNSNDSFTHHILIHPYISCALYISLSLNFTIWSGSNPAMNPSRRFLLNSPSVTSCFIHVKDI